MKNTKMVLIGYYTLVNPLSFSFNTLFFKFLKEMESFLQTSREESEEAVEPRTSPIPQCSAEDDTSTAITVTVDPGTTFKRDTAVQAQPVSHFVYPYTGKTKITLTL